MKPIETIRGIAFILTMILACSPTVAARPEPDTVTFGNSGSEREHKVTPAGQVRSEIFQTELGALKKTYPVPTVAKKGELLAVSSP